MWLAILGTAFVLMVAGLLYLYSRFRKFGIVRRIAGDRRWLLRLSAALPVLLLIVYGLFDLVNMAIVVIHLAAFWLIGDAIAALIARIRRQCSRGTGQSENGREAQSVHRAYITGIVVIAACAVYLAIGRYQAYHVRRTPYSLTTDKELPDGKLRIVQIADSHIGTTFGPEKFAEYLRVIAKENPDILVITGDFVDDNTTQDEMLAACRAFAEVKLRYGIWFCYGNHDKGYYNHRGYTWEELEAALEANGVTVLEDEAALLADSFYIIGRRDRNDAGHGRLTAEELTGALDKGRYMIMLDHQPNDYAAESDAGVDLVLSGHTHGGQLIPLGPIGRLLGANDRTYGTETRGNTTFIVTSGISDWEIRFKTGAKSEYVVIDIVSESKR